MFNETLVLSIICEKCCTNNNTILQKKESNKMLKIIGLTHIINE